MIGKGQGPQLEVARIQSEINRLFETLLRLRDGQAAGGTWQPAVDMSESPTDLVVEIELPGVDPKSIEMHTASGELFIKGDRPTGGASAEGQADVVHDEREFGVFERVVQLNTAVNTHKAVAVLSRGVMRIELPKVPNRRGAAVPISFQEL